MSLWYMRLVETNRIPDWLIKRAVRARLMHTLRQQYRANLEERATVKQALIAKLRRSPIAIHTGGQ